MKTWKIPHTDITVSRISYGCMKIGVQWNHEPLKKEEKKFAADLIAAALEEGINFFDHADIYMIGKSEEAFSGIWSDLGVKRDDVVLQTKCGILFEGSPNPNDPQRYNLSYDHIIQSTENSLKRLQTDYVDIMLFHRPDALVEPEDVARAADDLYRSGKVRYFGVSNHTASQIALLQKYMQQPIVANQVELNILHSYLIDEGVEFNRINSQSRMAEGTLDYCRLHDIMVQAWAPVAGGKMFVDPSKESDPRIKNTAALIAELSKQKQTSKEAIALAWLLRHPAKILPVVGTTNIQRLKDACLADDIELSREEWYSLYIAGKGVPLP